MPLISTNFRVRTAVPMGYFERNSAKSSSGLALDLLSSKRFQVRVSILFDKWLETVHIATSRTLQVLSECTLWLSQASTPHTFRHLKVLQYIWRSWRNRRSGWNKKQGPRGRVR